MGKEQLEWVLHLFKIDLILISGVWPYKRNLEVAEVCNLICFWYNEDTKRAERELDSNVAR